MAIARRVRDVLAGKASENFVGRKQELAALLECLTSSGPLVTWIHGIAGVGKSALLDVFSAKATAAGAAVVRLDCRLAEPTADGFCRELGRVLQTPIPSPDAAADVLGKLATRTVLVIDSYELFRLVDAWLRQTFIPSLSDTVKVLVSSRFPPGPSWVLPLEWQGLFRSLPLHALIEPDALELLARAGVEPPDAERINHFARGHPLALRLALSATISRAASELELGAMEAVVQKLTSLYLAGVNDPTTRRVIEAASVVRCATQSLLQAMVPGAGPDVYDRLASTSFVEMTRDGLLLHNTIRAAVSSSFRSSDPHRFQSYRQAAWRQLRSEARAASREEMWRYTADMIFLLQNPVVREAFFPSSAQPVNVEQTVPSDAEAIRRIAAMHETPAAARIIERWWEQLPESFRAIRDATGDLGGFYILIELGDKAIRLAENDPLMRSLRQHLRECPISKDETAVYVRRWLSSSNGELPSPVQAACWLDVKRPYMELRPHLRRCYFSVCDLATYGPTVQKLGARVVEGASVDLDDVTHHLAVVDFGPASIDGWLSGLVAAELGLDQGGILDIESRELLLDGKRIGLTALEFELFRYLYARQGKAVSRTELLEQVWECRSDSSSNVVDVVIQSLRKKMAGRATMIATVRGVGYRLGE